MKRIVVVSDTHDRLDYAQRAIEAIDVFDILIHLGDYARDGEDLKIQYPQYEFYAVRGNNDYFSPLPDERIIQVGEVRILLTHGHLHRVRSGIQDLAALAKEKQVQCVLFGHTHEPFLEKSQGVLFLNPGGYSHYPRPGVGIIEIDSDYLEGCHYAI